MAPSSSTKRRKTITRRNTAAISANRRITRSIFKQQILHQNDHGSPSILPSGSSTSSTDDLSNADLNCPDNCCTPKSEKHRIPEIQACPPAPKKRRAVSNHSLRRSPMAFFAHPDLELFFLVVLRDVRVGVLSRSSN
ncbi:hypothetical protein Nepgr_001879 [Nepenthes gracilis]|uniref:Uncharacterized protein n=1 Tax=Nepenthes gracilis TaxID=150966 RepID=A0AAD3P6X3_NEPGR|nr:hypothetical protein Nepgr_001879 [Nepenthes gracilis]